MANSFNRNSNPDDNFDFYAGFRQYNRTESQDTTLRIAPEFKNYQHPTIPSVPPIQFTDPNQTINDQKSSLFGGCGISPINNVSNQRNIN